MKIKEVIDYKDLFTHCSLIGATGSGKTSYILAIIKNIILENSNNNLVFIDGKNDLNLTKKLKDLAKQYNYDFYFFDNDNHHNNNFDYCYFENKTYMQIKEIILRLRTKELSNSSMGATYYFNQVNNYLFFIINLLMKNNIKITWKNLKEYSNYSQLKILEEFNEEEYQLFNYQIILDALNFINQYEEIENNNFGVSLNSILSSSNNIILFSLNFLSLPNYSNDLAHAVCLDLRQSIKNKDGDLFIILDEFGSYINSDLKTILEQGRSYHTSLILAYQSLAQINFKNFKNIIFDNTNNWFIFNNKHENSLKELSLLFGYKQILNYSYSLDLNHDNKYINNNIHLRNDETYYVSPDEIKNLKPLECFIKTIKEPRFLSLSIDD